MTYTLQPTKNNVIMVQYSVVSEVQKKACEVCSFFIIYINKKYFARYANYCYDNNFFNATLYLIINVGT